MKGEQAGVPAHMNAWTPPAPVEPCTRMDNAQRSAAGARPMRRSQKSPPVRLAQAEPRRLRLRYTKLGRVAYLAHLNLVRHLPRAFRRAGHECTTCDLGFIPSPS